jgi:hypothetical protein
VSRDDAGAFGAVRSAALNGTLLVVSLVVCFAALEIGLRLLGGVKETRWIPHDIDPNKRISFIPGSQKLFDTDEFNFVMKINSLGRRDIEWTQQMFLEPGNILFIGDSFIAGAGVASESTIPTLIESRSSDAGVPREVFNFGISRGGPRDYLALLDEALAFGIRAETVVVAFFVGNDFFPDVPSRSTPAKQASPRPRKPAFRSELLQFLKIRLSHSTRIIGWSLTLGRLFGVRVYDSLGSYVFLRNQTPEQEAVFRDRLQYLGRIKERCAENQRELFGVIIPNKIQVENADQLNDFIYDGAKPDRLILEYCREIGIECLDLLPVLTAAHRAGQGPIYFPVDRHLTPAGTRITADAIVEFLAASDAARWRPSAPL